MSGSAAAFVVIWLVMTVLGYVVGNSKGRGGLGLVLGLLLGLIGVIIIAVIPADKTKVRS